MNQKKLLNADQHRKIMNETVANNIKSIRLKHRMSMESFGNLLNAHKSLVSKWEKGITRPNSERLSKIANLGNITILELLGDTANKKIEELFWNLIYSEYEGSFVISAEESVDYIRMINLEVSKLGIPTEFINHNLVNMIFNQILLTHQFNLSLSQFNSIQSLWENINELSNLIAQIQLKINSLNTSKDEITNQDDLIALKKECLKSKNKFTHSFDQELNNLVNTEINDHRLE